MVQNNLINVTQSISFFGFTILGQSFDIFASSFSLAGNEIVDASGNLLYDFDSGVMYGSFSLGAIVTVDVTITGDIYYHYKPQ